MGETTQIRALWHPVAVKAGEDLAELTARAREVVLVAADGADTRAIAERLFLSPRTVEHHLSAAYRKLGVPNRAALVALLRDRPPDQIPLTRYAVSGDTHIAYQVLGDGPRDLIFIPGFISNVETAWTWPPHARFLRRLATSRRLIVFDKRGTGLSDPITDPASLTLEQRMDDVRAVMDAAGSHRAALLGFSEGAALSMLFAASYPSRTNGLILYGSLISPVLDSAANGVANVFADPAAAWEIMRQVWGSGQFLAPFAPTVASTQNGMAYAARMERHGASPAAAYAIIRMAAAIEVRGLCPAVHAPCLVLHRRDDVQIPRRTAGTWRSISLTRDTSSWKAPITRLGSATMSDFSARWSTSSASIIRHRPAPPGCSRPCWPPTVPWIRPCSGRWSASGVGLPRAAMASSTPSTARSARSNAPSP